MTIGQTQSTFEYADKGPLVYLAVNAINGKKYVGITMDRLGKRKSEHFCSAGKQKTYFANAIKKYGRENFLFRPLKFCSTHDELLKSEKDAIAALHPEYNLTLGGEGVLGMRHTLAARQKMSEDRKGKPANHSPEGRARIIAAHLGKKRPLEYIEKTASKNRGQKRTLECRQRMAEIKKANPSRYWLGKKRSMETIEKIRAKHIGKKRKPPAPEILEIFKNNMRRAAANRRKPVICLNDNNSFSSATEAAQFYNLKKCAVCNCCKNKTETIGGFRFRWRNEQ